MSRIRPARHRLVGTTRSDGEPGEPTGVDAGRASLQWPVEQCGIEAGDLFAPFLWTVDEDRSYPVADLADTEAAKPGLIEARDCEVRASCRPLDSEPHRPCVGRFACLLQPDDI